MNTPIRIALETSFADRPFSGIGTYLVGLQSALAAVPDIDLIPIHPPLTSLFAHAGERVDRFSWETWRAGFATRSSKANLLHMPLMAVPIGAGRPVVATVHDVIPYVLPEYSRSRAMQLNLAVARHRIQHAAAVLAPSLHAAHDIVTVLGIPKDRVHVTREAVSPTLQPATSPHLAAEIALRIGIQGRYIFNVGGFDVRKNLPLLIEAFATLRSELPEPVTLVIAGAPHTSNPVIFPPLQPVIERFGLGGSVRLIGRISDADKRQLLQHAAANVSPSIYEGFGLSVLESMACGVPVIAANRTSLPEVVGDAGLLVEPDRVTLAEAMFRLLTDNKLHTDLAARGLARARTFRWERCAQETVAVYRGVLA